MFDIIGIVVSDKTLSFGWGPEREIAILICSASTDDEAKKDSTIIPLRFKELPLPQITEDSWVKARFELASGKYQKNGQDAFWLRAKGVKIKVLYAAKPKAGDVTQNKTQPQDADIEDFPF